MMLFLVIGLAAAGLSSMVLSVYLDPAAKRRRALRSGTSVSIRDFPEGQLGKIVGVVDGRGTTLKAPVTGRACVYYALQIQQMYTERDGDVSLAWDDPVNEEAAQNFLLRDETGSALILLQGAQIALTESKFELGKFHKFPKQVQDALSRYPELRKAIAVNTPLRYRETVIEHGARIAVLGYGMRQPDPDPRAAQGDYRGVAMQLVMQGRRDQPLVISDEPAATESAHDPGN